MGKSPISQSIRELIEPVIQADNLELVDVEYKREGKHWILRVFIDKDRGITVDDCKKVSQQIDDLIEVDNLIHSSYVLEVSSPGLDRPLKRERDFLKFKDKKVRVHTYSPIKDRRNFTGTIRGFKNHTLFLEIEGEEIEIPLEKIAQARLIIEI